MRDREASIGQGAADGDVGGRVEEWEESGCGR